jgi:Na+-driven multidrug efflux pump
MRLPIFIGTFVTVAPMMLQFKFTIQAASDEESDSVSIILSPYTKIYPVLSENAQAFCQGFFTCGTYCENTNFQHRFQSLLNLTTVIILSFDFGALFFLVFEGNILGSIWINSPEILKLSKSYFRVNGYAVMLTGIIQVFHYYCRITGRNVIVLTYPLF